MKASVIARINVTVAYEDFAAGKRANDLLDRIHSMLGGGFGVDRHMWKFDVLGVPAMQRMAVEDATGADLILIATTDPSEPPREVRDWIKQWTPVRGVGRSAFVLLTEIGSGDESVLPAVCTYCRREARQAGMNFFCNHQSCSGDPGYFSYDGADSRIENLSPLIRQITGRGYVAAEERMRPAGRRGCQAEGTKKVES